MNIIDYTSVTVLMQNRAQIFVKTHYHTSYTNVLSAYYILCNVYAAQLGERKLMVSNWIQPATWEIIACTNQQKIDRYTLRRPNASMSPICATGVIPFNLPQLPLSPCFQPLLEVWLMNCENTESNTCVFSWKEYILIKLWWLLHHCKFVLLCSAH